MMVVTLRVQTFSEHRASVHIFAIMVFKLTVATLTLAAFASASIVNRVACPGGTTFASDEAVSALTWLTSIKLI